jgi:pyruvate dehydrogenase E1 component
MSETFEAPDQIIDQLVDTDPSETAEWHASFDAALANAGTRSLFNVESFKACP